MNAFEAEDGFTLLETLVAFVILAGAFAISAQTIAIAARSISISDERSDVLKLVKSIRVGVAMSNVSGNIVTSLDHKNLRWSTNTHTPEGATTSGSPAFVSIMVTAPSGRVHKFVYFETGSSDAK